MFPRHQPEGPQALTVAPLWMAHVDGKAVRATLVIRTSGCVVIMCGRAQSQASRCPLPEEPASPQTTTPLGALTPGPHESSELSRGSRRNLADRHRPVVSV